MDRAGDGHPAEVVPEEVGDHHVLGPVLLRRGQREPDPLVLREEASAPGRPLHGARGHPVALPQEEELRRGGGDGAIPGAHVGRVARALRPAQPVVEVERVALHPAPETEGEVHLVDGAGGDSLPDRLHRLRVDRGVELRRGTGEPGVGRPRSGHGERGVVQAEPGERSRSRPHPERGVEGRRRLVGHEADRPSPRARRALGGPEDRHDLGEGPGLDHLAGCAEGERAPARRVELEQGVD